MRSAGRLMTLGPPFLLQHTLDGAGSGHRRRGLLHVAGRLAFYYLLQNLISMPAAINMPEQKRLSDKEVRFIFVELPDSINASAIKELCSRFTQQSELTGHSNGLRRWTCDTRTGLC